ncbi:hypothetical protein ACFVYE_31295 [Streptomyces sp. NPDC058239]|uniref:hypothetical protein n=1 Tax=unclassified Streptomyces TaxID=2593676 RepID=UPI0036542E8B
MNAPYWRVDRVEELDAPEAMRRLAASASAAIRRTVARARHLTPDVLDHLSHAPDPQIQSSLAYFCEDAMAGRLAKLVPGGQTATVPAAARYPNMENPVRFSAELTSFLETV